MTRLTQIIFTVLLAVLFFEVLIGFPIQVKNEKTTLINSLEPPKEDEKEKKKQEESQSLVAEQKMQGVHLVESLQGARDWELFADTAAGYEAKAVWELKHVKVYFYEHDHIEMTVTGDSGNVETKKKDMEIRGNVVAESANGYKFKTESLAYNSSDRTLNSQDKILMEGPRDDLKLSGFKMRASLDDSSLKIFENVTAERKMKGKKVFIKSNGAEFSAKNDSAKFYDNVVIEMDKFKIQGPEAYFQYKTNTETLDSIFVKGGVRVNDENRVATAENVDFLPEEDKMILEGKPKLIQNNDEIAGDKIILTNGGKKIKVLNLNANVDAK